MDINDGSVTAVGSQMTVAELGNISKKCHSDDR